MCIQFKFHDQLDKKKKKEKRKKKKEKRKKKKEKRKKRIENRHRSIFSIKTQTQYDRKNINSRYQSCEKKKMGEG